MPPLVAWPPQFSLHESLGCRLISFNLVQRALEWLIDEFFVKKSDEHQKL